jgi:hypothetical protein
VELGFSITFCKVQGKTNNRSVAMNNNEDNNPLQNGSPTEGKTVLPEDGEGMVIPEIFRNGEDSDVEFLYPLWFFIERIVTDVSQTLLRVGI